MSAAVSTARNHSNAQHRPQQCITELLWLLLALNLSLRSAPPLAGWVHLARPVTASTGSATTTGALRVVGEWGAVAPGVKVMATCMHCELQCMGLERQPAMWWASSQRQADGSRHCCSALTRQRGSGRCLAC